MRKIAIFVSGEGASAERIVNLFNEGNRLRTEVVVVSDSARGLIERLSQNDVTLLHIPDEEWDSRSKEITEIIKANHISLLVLDNFVLPVSEDLLAATDGRIISVSNADQAPREVVAELEADLRRPKQEPPVKRDENVPPTPEEEWAASLKINFTPPKVPMDPPPVPEEETPSGGEIFNEGVVPPRNPERQFVQPPVNQEPMPSTYLVWSILTTIFCCFIPGIVAIIYSSMVSTKYFGGDIEGARRASRMAEIWIIVSVVVGVVAATLYIPFAIIGG